MQKEIFSQLTQEEPPPRDIFTVFRENHPETIFELQRFPQTVPPDFSKKTEIALRSGETPTLPNSTLQFIKDRAIISDSNKAVAITVDVNACLKDRNWEGAEHLLGRPLTVEEKQSQMVKEQQEPLVDQARRQLKLEELKARIKSEKAKRKALLAKWKAVRDKADKAAKAAIKAEIDRVNQIINDSYEGIANLFNDDDDDDDDLDLGGDGSGPDDSDDDDRFDDAVSLDQSVATDVTRRRGDHEEKDDAESIASTVLDKNREKRGKARVRNEVPPLDPDMEYSRDNLVMRANQLRQAYPELKAKGNILSSLSGRKDLLRARIEQAEKWIDQKRDEEFDRRQTKGMHDYIGQDILATPDRRKGNDRDSLTPYFGKDTPDRVKQTMDSFDESLANVNFSGEGIQVKGKKPGNYVKWNDRFVINRKRLVDTGTFALYYPRSGQPHNQIKTAHLTPALKEVVLAYLDNQPQDTTALSPEELKWVKTVWRMSGVTKPQPAPKLRIAPKLYKGKQDMRDRVKELMGLCLAGNDNPALVEEMTKLVDRLEDRDWLSKEEIINSRRFISGL